MSLILPMETLFSRVRFNNFRNLEPREIKWSPGLNLLTGNNGSGKTNVLEGINIISGWGPLERGTFTSSLPTWKSGSDEVRLTGQIGSDGEIIQVKILGRCTMKIDEKNISATDLRWKIPVLTFLPNDMTLIEGSASYRRRLIDMILSLIIPPYAIRLNNFRRGIRQKTSLLRKCASTFAIDRVLMPLAAWIWKMRDEGTQLLEECLSQSGELLPGPVSLRLKRGGACRCSTYEDEYIEGLMRLREREFAMKTPLVGPHRDDILIESNGMPATEAFSRGFRRRVAIAIMLAAADAVKRKIGKDPVLLFDEVTAELDPSGRRALFETLGERGSQIMAATAEQFEEEFPGTVYRVEEGKVRELNEN